MKFGIHIKRKKKAIPFVPKYNEFSRGGLAQKLYISRGG
jgi:hypothetical protein